MRKRVLMLGWEFPPFISGGLGTACYGLTKAMSSLGTDVLFVLPKPARPEPTAPPAAPPPTTRQEFWREHGSTAQSAPFENVHFKTVDSWLSNPYQAPKRVVKGEVSVERGETRSSVAWEKTQYATLAGPAPAMGDPKRESPYAGDLMAEVQRYASLVLEVARHETFSVVHAHDWMTYPAGLAVSAARGLPLVVHVHSTEFDRSGEHVNQRVYDIERRGMHGAIRVIAVSHYTRNIIIHRYGVDPAKVEVVHNAVEQLPDQMPGGYTFRKTDRVALFVGRLTMQKGPEYFLQAAAMVTRVMKGVKFVMAGSGEMAGRLVEIARELGIADRVVFTGFLSPADVARLMGMADLYVMPSVSEPFGISALEALSHKVPVIVSKQSGVGEVMTHVLKVDFWDTREMANKMVAVLKRPPLAKALRQHGGIEVRKLSWTDSARACMAVYDAAIAAVRSHPGFTSHRAQLG